MLSGHIAARKADFPGAIDHLHAAARLEDGLVYGEPPEWTVPVRQDLGSVLLAAGRNEEAEQAYREDLKRFPENGWSLHGLAQTLRTQNRSQEADAVMERFRKVWAGADMQLAAAAR
ncbi:tetratricopeptide repeat protein [Azotobacter sp. CWF10]